MTRLQPSVAEERWMAVRELVGKNAFAEERCGGWRSSSLLARCGFFVLATICVLALFGVIITGARHFPPAAFISGIISMVIAESLILGARFFGSGFDEALWFEGALLVMAAFGEDTHHIFLFLAVGALAAGVRLLNPLFFTAGVVLVAAELGDRLDSAAAAWFCAIVAITALALLPVRRRRPSLDRTLQWLVVILPAAAYLFAKDGQFRIFELPDAAALLGYGVAAAFIGIRFRLHAPLLALFPTLALFAYEVREVSGLQLETRLMLWGSVTLIASVVLERRLRTPQNGLTSAQLRDDRLMDLVQLAGAAALTQHAKPEAPEPGLQAGGGAFGGAGASGDV